MAVAVFPDNTVLCNFAVVRKLDLLEGFLRGRGHWTEAVAYEAQRSSDHGLPDLAGIAKDGWLGEPVEIDDDGREHVEHLRRAVFGGTRDQPLKHLGEAETCHLLKEDPSWRGSWWVSDDRDALDFARKQGITTLETIDIVKHIVAEGDLTTNAAWDLMQEMANRARVLRLPRSLSDLSH